MTRCFGDTSYFIALMSPDDVAHRAAVRFNSSFDGLIFTTQWVMIELGNYFSNPQFRSNFCNAFDRLEANRSIQMIAATDSDFRSGLGLYRNRPDKEWSLVDCISMHVAQRLHLRDVLTTDHHFTQAGFNALLIP